MRGRFSVLAAVVVLIGVGVLWAKGPAPAPAPRPAAAHSGGSKPRYRIGKAPKPEFKAGEKAVKIDPESPEVKHVRKLHHEEFHPLHRRARLAEFYRRLNHERFEAWVRRHRWHIGPYRAEFVFWMYDWPLEYRVRWARAHRRWIDKLLWDEWMADARFAAAMHALEASHEVVAADYLPPEYAQTSPVAMYNDAFIDAAYNPVPFLAVANLTSLKTDPANDWIGKAAAESLMSKLSALPGMFLAEQSDVQTAMAAKRTTSKLFDVNEPSHAAEVGQAIDVEQIVTGNYVVDADKVLLNLRLVDVDSGRVLNGFSNTVPRDHLLDALPAIAESIATWLNKADPDGGADEGGPQSPGLPMPAPSPTGPVAIPRSVVSGASVPAKQTFADRARWTGSMLSLTAAGGPYEFTGMYFPPDGAKNYQIVVEAGADIRGGSIHWGSNGGRMEVNGTAENPAVFRNIEIGQQFGGSFAAHYAVFDNCRFRKVGAYYSRSGYSTKWEFDHCLIRGSASFTNLHHIDVGFHFSDCTFADIEFAEIGIPGPKDQPADMMKILRSRWDTIERCRFDACTVPLIVLWCGESCNYTRCKFVPSKPFDNPSEADATVFVAEPTGDMPDKVQAGTPPARAKINIHYVNKPYEVYAFPSSR